METPLRWALVASALVAVCSAGVPVKRQAVYYSPQHRPYAYSQAPVFQTSQVRAVPQYEYQPQPQIPYQRVIVYNPNTGSAVYQQLPSAPAAPADVYPVGPGQFLIPLRADGATQGGSGAAEGSGGGSTGGSGGGILGFGGFNPTDYLTVFQNYWQSLTGTGTNSQTINKPAEAAGPAGAAGAEAPPTPSAEGSKRPEMAEAPMPMPMPMPAAPMPTAQRFLVLSQPNVISNPGVNPAAPASNGGVSTYLLLRNQGAPVPVYSYAAQQPAQATLPSGAGPMVLVRTADNKYGLAPASQPGRVLISGEGIRAQDDVQVSGPGSQAIAYQRFLLGRQGQLAPGFYPTLNPSVVHSLADESISVESAGKDASGSGSTEQPASSANSTGAEGDVVDSDSEPPVSIAQVKPSAIALAGPGGVAAAAPMGTALVGPGGMALAAPSATAVAGPSAQSAAVVAPSAHTASHNADAYKKWLSRKKVSIASDESEAPIEAPIVPEYLIQYGPQ